MANKYVIRIDGLEANDIRQQLRSLCKTRPGVQCVYWKGFNSAVCAVTVYSKRDVATVSLAFSENIVETRGIVHVAVLVGHLNVPPHPFMFFDRALNDDDYSALSLFSAPYVIVPYQSVFDSMNEWFIENEVTYMTVDRVKVNGLTWVYLGRVYRFLGGANVAGKFDGPFSRDPVLYRAFAEKFGGTVEGFD